jgi:hypothetical protein
VFKLYKEQQNTFPFVDYGMLLREVAGAKSALEFGPGISTLALIEAGVGRIVTLEHDPIWFVKAKEKFKDYPQVEVRPYKDEPVVEADVEGEFDIAFVDSPKGFVHVVRGVEGARKKHPGQEDCSRLNTCLFALKHAPIVYLHDASRPLERGTLGRLNKMGHRFEFTPGRAGMAKIWRSPEQT